MNEPKCPYCGETMTAKATFYDKYSGKYTSHAKCWSCGAQGPLAKSTTPFAATNKALKNTLNRPKQKPLRWALLEKTQVVYLEDWNKLDIIPALTEQAEDKDVMHFLTGKRECVILRKVTYGRSWRAWASPPTGEERAEAAWM